MSSVICRKCIEDSHLAKALEEYFQQLTCSECGQRSRKAVTVEALAAVIEPVLREYFVQGGDIKHFGEDDSEWYEQDGESLDAIIQQVTEQDFVFQEELVRAICDLDDAWPPDGDEVLWDSTASYVPRRMRPHEMALFWEVATQEIKHGQRFFSPSVRLLFDRLFAGVGTMYAYAEGTKQPVTVSLSTDTAVYRSRVCASRAMMKDASADPMKHVGPPPAEMAKAGRMNAEGVVVLYTALDPDTARAELRPAIGSDLAVIKMTPVRRLKVLDMARLETVAAGALSYFQPDYEEEVLKHAFLRRLHRMISQPIVPGHEADYLITQAMAEYLANVHPEKYDGIKFTSAQNQGGMNLVLFSRSEFENDEMVARFGVDYVSGSIEFSRTSGVQYSQEPLVYFERQDGEPVAYMKNGDYDLDDLE